MSNEQLDDLNQDQTDEKIAELLGISIDEYRQLDHEGIQDDLSADGGLVYRHYIEFKDTSPRSILDKIQGLDSNDTFYFDPGAL